jgi:transcription initiation factor TFIIIB Brf1 subunit/transcription initiation factor TFIIB
MECENCGSDDVEHDESDDILICNECGYETEL